MRNDRDMALDCIRAGGDPDKRIDKRILRKDNGFRYLYYWRRLHHKLNPLSFLYYKICLRREAIKYGLEIPLSVELGPGALMIHPSQITINSKSVIGANFTVLKGATVGNIKDGPRSGSPIIGNNVYIGLNAVVVGGIRIGNDVLVAPNSYVNFDVPDHSIVIGNPGVIHKKQNATKEYIVRAIKDEVLYGSKE